MDSFEDVMSHPNSDVILPHESDNISINNEVNENIITCEDPNESSLLNSIVEAVMRGDMNEVVTLALSHRNTDSKDRGIVDQALSTALRNKFKCDQIKDLEKEIHCESKIQISEKNDDLSEAKPDPKIDQSFANTVYSTTMKSDEGNEIQCSYYIDSNSIESTKNNTYCQSGFHNQNIDFENHSDDHLNGNFSQYQTSTSTFHKFENLNSLKPSQQSVQVQLPGIGNFLLQLPSNFKPGEPITLPISLPLTPASQASGGNPISINMNTGQIISNQLLSLYNPSSCINNMTMGKKMRAIAPKPSKPTYRQPLIAPKTDSPNVSTYNQDCANMSNSTPLPAPTGPGRRKGTKGKKVGRKRGPQPKSRKDSSYASSTHSIDSQDTIQFNESSNTLKQNCNNYISSRNTYQCNYFVNNDSSDYINQSHAVPQSYNELHSNNLIDASDSGEKDLLSLAWEISNADLGNNDDFSTTYQLYDTNNLGTESFVSSEILDQFLQNIQKDDLSDLSRCSSAQINLDSRVSYASSFTTLPPCSTVLPSVTTSNYLNNSSDNQSNIELSNCIEIAEVVNLNTEDMLSELEKDENALLDKFVAQYSSSTSCSFNSQQTGIAMYRNHISEINSNENKADYPEKDLDPNIKESNELSEIAKQIEKDCDVSSMGNTSMTRNYLSQHEYVYQKEINVINRNHETYLQSDSDNFCRQVVTPLDLIYSTSTDSFSSTVIDSKNHYMMSVNMDAKLQNEATYYITNGSLKSKTLDDFGLLDFCTDTGENHYSETDGLDDKRYLEPPILEDISDATPIPSDEESVDEDIDLCEFKLSTSNHLTLYSNRIYHNRSVDVENIWNISKMNDLLTLLDLTQLESQSFSSDKWYIYDNFIDISDVFSYTDIVNRNDEENIHVHDLKSKNRIDDNTDLDNQNNVKLTTSSIKSTKHKRVHINYASNQTKAKERGFYIKTTKPRKVKRNINNFLNEENNVEVDDIQNNATNEVTKHKRVTRNINKSLNHENIAERSTDLNDKNKIEESRRVKTNLKKYSKDENSDKEINVKIKRNKFGKVKRNSINALDKDMVTYNDNSELNNHFGVKETTVNTESTKHRNAKNDTGQSLNDENGKESETYFEDHFDVTQHGVNIESTEYRIDQNFTNNSDKNEPESNVDLNIENQAENDGNFNDENKAVNYDHLNDQDEEEIIINNPNNPVYDENMIMCSEDVNDEKETATCDHLTDKNNDEETNAIIENIKDKENYTTLNIIFNDKNKTENRNDLNDENKPDMSDIVNNENKTPHCNDLDDQQESKRSMKNNVNNFLNDGNIIINNDDLNDENGIEKNENWNYVKKFVKCDILNNENSITSADYLNDTNSTTRSSDPNDQNQDEDINTNVVPTNEGNMTTNICSNLNDENKIENGENLKDQNSIIKRTITELTKHRKHKKNTDNVLNKVNETESYSMSLRNQNGVFDESTNYRKKINSSLHDKKKKENDNDLIKFNDITQASVNVEKTKHRSVKRNISNSLFDLNSSNYKDRQSRLRKPPMKLAIYQSIKFIENEFLVKNSGEVPSNKDLEINKVKKEVDKPQKPLKISKINHCTRSKGLISKSFDSFYETLEKSKRHQHPKMKKMKHHLHNKKKYKSNAVDDNIERHNFEFIDARPTDIINANFNESQYDNLVLPVNAVVKNLSKDTTILKSFSGLKTKQSKKFPNVSKKYNLRKGSVEDQRNFKSSCEKKSRKVDVQNEPMTAKPKRFKKKNDATVQNKDKVNEKGSVFNKINFAEIEEEINHFDILIGNDFIIKHLIEPLESGTWNEMHSALVTIVHMLSCDVVEVPKNNCVLECNKSEISFKKLFPVRKINRKLRLLSGLVYEKQISHCTVHELEGFENLTEYRVHSGVMIFIVFSNLLISGLDCKYSKNNELESKFEYQIFEANDEDFDDADSCDARLVIVENEDILSQTLVDNSKTTIVERLENITNINIQNNVILHTELCVPKEVDVSNRYSLRNKSKDISTVNSDVLDETSVISAPLKRQSLKRSCKRLENFHNESNPENIYLDENALIFKSSINQPICLIENITNCGVILYLEKDSLSLTESNSYMGNSLIKEDLSKNGNEMELQSSDNNSPSIGIDIENEIIGVQTKDEIASRILKRIKENKLKFKIYRNHLRFIWRTKVSKSMNYSVRLRKKFQVRKLLKIPNMEDNLALIENEIDTINFEQEDLSKNCENNESECIEVTDEIIDNNKSCTIVDSNNVETFSRSYGSFSLKIKFQKQDPMELQENKSRVRKRKKGSKKRKKLRHFLNSIIGSNDTGCNKSNSGYESLDEESNYDSNGKIKRKRKHSSTTICSIDSSNQENINQNDKPPKLTPESIVNDDDNMDNEHQKPIKIKLFKSTNDDSSKSEEMIFSLQKSNTKNTKDTYSVPKMLQVLKDQQFKPCRQAANLAKKKIFSTAKEDRRSQNATLTSIWNPRKVNNALNKLPADFLNRCNDRRRRPRGRPPKSSQLALFSEKYMSSSGTLKLKIKLSKDFKNCNDDNLSSNGENSGRTSTNDSSILNSAVAGINQPSDGLSLESNNFINGITEQLDENIDYLEAKEAKVYFDPNQVDIEKIKNSYYSSKRNNSIHFDGSSHQNLYDDSSSEICDEKKNGLSTNQEFSNYNDNDSTAPYNNMLNNYSCNNKISHLPKELINVSENCYNTMSTNREPQDLSQSNQPYSFNNQISSPEKNQFDLWQSSKVNSAELLANCRNGNNAWFSKHRSFPNSNSIYDSYVMSNNKEAKSCVSQNQNSPFMVCENETSDSKHVEISLAKQSSNKEGRKSSNNSFESHSQLSPNQSRGIIGSVPSQLNIHNWSEEANHNSSLNHTAAAWMTYAQQQAAAAAYIDPQMKAYYNLALSQSMLNNPYCGAYGNPPGNPENFYSSLHSQYLSNSKDLIEKNHSSGTIRNHNDTMGTFMEAAQITSWEHFYSAAAMAGYHNTSQGAMDDYAGRAGNMLQAHHMLAGGYPGSVLSRDHFPIEVNKPPVAHQNQSGSTSPMKPISSPTPISSAPQAYSHVQMPYNHFNGTPVGFF